MIEKLINKYYRKLARRRLINRYTYLIQVNKLLEEYNTELLITGGDQHKDFADRTRKELIKLQSESKSNALLIKFLKKIK